MLLLPRCRRAPARSIATASPSRARRRADPAPGAGSGVDAAGRIRRRRQPAGERCGISTIASLASRRGHARRYRCWSASPSSASAATALPAAAHDVPLDAVVTERGVQYFKRKTLIMAYWLLKTEPETFGIDQLAASSPSAARAGTACATTRRATSCATTCSAVIWPSCTTRAAPFRAWSASSRVVRARLSGRHRSSIRASDHYDPGKRSGRAALVHDRRAAAAALQAQSSRWRNCARMRTENCAA